MSALSRARAASAMSSVRCASGGDAADPQARFYCGAFGNNRIDNGPVPRYRETAALPGFGIDELSGRRFVRQPLELVLPRALFDAAAVPDLHATWLRPARGARVDGLAQDPLMPGPRAARLVQRVSVTFCRPGGRSGSRPRARDSASTIR
jgi:hypothetical protein